MTTIYLPKEKVPLKIDDLVVHVQQLSIVQKAAILEALTQKDSETSLVDATRLALKYGVKGIDGLKLSDGTPYQLRFDGDVLTDDCVEEIFYIPCTDKIQTSCFALLKGISNPLVDAAGKVIPGVEVISSPPKKRQASKN